MKSLYAVIVSILFLSATQKAEARNCDAVFIFGIMSMVTSMISTGILADAFDKCKEKYQVENMKVFLKMKLENKFGEPGDVDKYTRLYEKLKDCGNPEAAVCLGMMGILLGSFLTFMTVVNGC